MLCHTDVLWQALLLACAPYIQTAHCPRVPAQMASLARLTQVCSARCMPRHQEAAPDAPLPHADPPDPSDAGGRAGLSYVEVQRAVQAQMATEPDISGIDWYLAVRAKLVEASDSLRSE